MTNQKPDQNTNFSEANQFDNLKMSRVEKQSTSESAKIEQKFTREQKAENELAHEQNITAHIPGGSTIADVD
jgi:hypothetical protein